MAVVVNILGAVALLLWGLRLVSTGVIRAFGAELRNWLNRVGNRVAAAGAGTAVTVFLQSSTATCLMAASFVGRGLMEPIQAQAAMLGANVGTALVAKALTFNVAPLAAGLLLISMVLQRSSEAARLRAWSRILLGLGLLLLSIRMLDGAAEPVRDAPQLLRVLADVDGIWLVGLILSAALTVVFHSSVATILLVLPLAAKGAFGLEFGMALVLGANLGSAIPPMLESGKQQSAERRVPVGNALVRLAGCVAVLAVLEPLATLLPHLGANAAEQLVNFHVLLNLCLAVLLMPLLGPLSRGLIRLIPDRPQAEDKRRPRYLDVNALLTPSVAIGCAARESMRIADQVEAMMRRSLSLLRGDDPQAVTELGGMDDVVDSLHGAVKLYLARLPAEDMDPDESRRVAEIMTFVINLEHIGDIIDRNLKDLGEKKLRHHLTFSQEGLGEITAMFDHTMENLKAAMAVFLSGDIRLARRLVSDKEEIRNLERRATAAHFARIRDGRRESIATSALHLDVLRDLKRINAHIASVAYPILEQSGELAHTRLKTSH